MATLFVSDLDGTLLDKGGRLSPVSREALERLIAEGLVFSVASARSVASMQSVLRDLRITLPVIEFNGAFLSDLHTGRHEIVNAIEPALAQDAYALIGQYACAPFVSTYDGRADRLYYGNLTNAGERHYVDDRRAHEDRRLRQTASLAETLREPVVCLTVIGEQARLAELELAARARLGDAVEIHFFENAYSPGWHWLTIHDRRATKDQAIRLLVERYGLRDHELVVFGDHINDVKMFKIAGRAVAVANAHPEVKRHATHVIGAHHEDSVVRYIEDHFANGRKLRPPT
jgi:Cof subfamily protein (haloacid dehalogenase superfamily)